MSEEAKGQPSNGQGQQNKNGVKPGVAHRIVITLDQAGQISIDAPVENKILCYGMLESGKDALQEYYVQQAAVAASKRIQPAEAAALKHLRG